MLFLGRNTFWREGEVLVFLEYIMGLWLMQCCCEIVKIELDCDGELFSFNGWISENRDCNERRECEVRRWKSIQVV